ncbi:hypothetical protein LUZ62_059981 [Rhynchospora pubera]|uniref:Extradiol ring-cleavage dioxygenase class III enzyme subunit B domain-containing protein n=1 Tax=Rhynchospora pubera TaxID=906938 RepID=A0AAV8E5I3_9POAL|nr:hypothetical protein LUZ62_059981 [Rhynchospora pubera]
MDTFFISHGAPILITDDSNPQRSFLQSWKPSIMQEAPKAILMVSAHWDTESPTLKYPAPGAPDLAQRVKELLNKSGFGPVKEDKTRGLDHAAWVILMLMYPDAKIPVCQLSVQTIKSAEYHYKLGQALSQLRDEGVLIIGSGNATQILTRGLRRLLLMEAPLSKRLISLYLNQTHKSCNHQCIQTDKKYITRE